MAQRDMVADILPNGANLEAQTKSAGELPRIPLDLWEKRVSIAVTWSVLVFFNGALPILLYWVLKYSAHLRPVIVLAIPTAIFGVVSLAAWHRRLFSLIRRSSTTRPIGGSRRGLDYFQWNFTFGFIYITICIVVAETQKPEANVRVAAIPLSLLMIQICLQIVVAAILVVAGATYPVPFSSGRRGEAVRSALVTIIEDVVAVDGGQGQAFRKAFVDRYDVSPHMRRLLQCLSWMWGTSGVAVATTLIALIFTLDNEDVSWTIGWSVPFAWAGLCTVITIIWTKSFLHREKAEYEIQASE